MNWGDLRTLDRFTWLFGLPIAAVLSYPMFMVILERYDLGEGDYDESEVEIVREREPVHALGTYYPEAEEGMTLEVPPWVWGGVAFGSVVLGLGALGVVGLSLVRRDDGVDGDALR